MTVYEEAKGELRYGVYLAHHSATLQLNVGARVLERVLSDTSTATGERQAIVSEVAERILVPITDRLVISPSRSTFATMGTRRGAGRTTMASFSSQGFALRIRFKVQTLCLKCVWLIGSRKVGLQYPSGSDEKHEDYSEKS